MERPKNSFRKFFSTRRKNEFVDKDDLFEIKRSMSVFDRLKQFSRRKERSKVTDNHSRFESVFISENNNKNLM